MLFPAAGVLQRKLRREMWQQRGQWLAIALVIAGGVSVCLMSLVNVASLEATRDAYYREQVFADIFTTLKRAPRHLHRQIEALDGVSRVSTRIEAAARLEVPGYADPVSARLVSLPLSAQPEVNRLFLRRGRLPGAGRHTEVAVIGSFADAHALEPGDPLAAVINGRRQTVTVVGIVESPEFIYALPPGGMLPDYERYGVLWLSEESLAAAVDVRGAFNSVALTVDRELSTQRVIDALDRLLAPYGGSGAYARDEQLSHRFLSDELAQLRTMALVFPGVFLSVAMFLLHVVLARLVNTQRDVVAVLKAFGYSNRQIAWHYSQMILAVAVLGIVLGSVAGLWFGRALGALYMEYYRFPALLFELKPGWLLQLSLLVMAVAWFAGWRAIRAAAGLPPAEAMRPEGPTRYRITPAERLLAALPLQQPSRMILRHLLRRPARTLLSVTGVAMATAVVIVGSFQFGAVTLMMHTQFSRVQAQDITASLVEPTSPDAVLTLARMPGVRYAEGRRGVAVELVHEQRRWRGALTGMPADAQLQFVVDAALNPVRLPPSGLLLTDFLAERLAVAPGDSLEVRVLEGARPRLVLPVAGTTSEFLGVGAYMELSALNRALADGRRVNQVLMTLEPGAERAVYRALREQPAVMGLTQRAVMLDSFFETLARTFLTYTFVISLLGGIIAFGVIYNTVKISLSERGRDLASLRVLGYRRAEVAHILLGELAVILLLGIPFGWFLGHALASGMVAALQTELYRVPLVITGRNLGLAASAVLLSGLLSGAMIGRRLKHMDLVAVLKTRE